MNKVSANIFHVARISNTHQWFLKAMSLEQRYLQIFAVYSCDAWNFHFPNTDFAITGKHAMVVVLAWMRNCYRANDPVWTTVQSLWNLSDAPSEVPVDCGWNEICADCHTFTNLTRIFCHFLNLVFWLTVSLLFNTF
jgi:hypothetical protein